jgi:hypothetical protein
VPRSQFSHEKLSVYFHTSKQSANNVFCTYNKRATHWQRIVETTFFWCLVKSQ